MYAIPGMRVFALTPKRGCDGVFTGPDGVKQMKTFRFAVGGKQVLHAFLQRMLSPGATY